MTINPDELEVVWDHRVYLCASVNALVEGLYEQKIPFTQVKESGDFGKLYPSEAYITLREKQASHG